ncbi:multidrug ABC transporter permease [Streptomyces lunaelactis]|uniref:Transport permease protein n=1 Tax=Streptomyces lunaelactis TaxID=1535768 RepID=A0A2R4T3J7_9ACTN|nr:ABC transporter permease [Streptomyces lunaelactis]AVZ73719.1 multidrug ABC transporter permease [Streptomyces lunaelactis]NUK03095.1 ABC transporter permease [Streptomyces lunaelactis]NUK09859.1 ABC transporter permease [Streptomyces lunaelactis]NUK17438.1 ABC transporter permease [Streptomyces lunaelactis]NUK36200.1 ABC transporter permease [Streptomyces lunaelactis]
MSAVELKPAGAPERRIYWTVVDCWNVVRRGLTHYQRQPVYIAWQLGFPILSVLLYGYVFGGAMKQPGDGDYRDFLMPGMFVMTMAFGFMNTATTVVNDATKGVIDRFRSMPMAPSAVVAGRGVNDLIVACAELSILAATAFAMGWRSDGGVLGTLAGFGLLLLLRFCLIWVGVWLGLLVPSPEAAGGLYAVVFPFTMISSIFVPPSSMPDWLGTVAAWNPISSTAAATRELFGNPVAGDGSWIQEHALLMAVVWPLVMTAVFLPLAVRRFQRLSR